MPETIDMKKFEKQFSANPGYFVLIKPEKKRNLNLLKTIIMMKILIVLLKSCYVIMIFIGFLACNYLLNYDCKEVFKKTYPVT